MQENAARQPGFRRRRESSCADSQPAGCFLRCLWAVYWAVPLRTRAGCGELAWGAGFVLRGVTAACDSCDNGHLRDAFSREMHVTCAMSHRPAQSWHRVSEELAADESFVCVDTLKLAAALLTASATAAATMLLLPLPLLLLLLRRRLLLHLLLLLLLLPLSVPRATPLNSMCIPVAYLRHRHHHASFMNDQTPQRVLCCGWSPSECCCQPHVALA